MPRNAVDRRTLLGLSAGTVAYVLGGGTAFADVPDALVTPQFAAAVPRLDGVLAFDFPLRRAMAVDWGKTVHRLPLGVLLPKSVEDIQKIVRFAADHALAIAMRGHGCSAYGQAQVSGGIVIDTEDFNAIRWASETELDCQPGALWYAVLAAAMERGQTPPVLPDTLLLTVGGTLSAGGIGYSSYRHGAAVDHVSEIDVVTGTGEMLTCSRHAHPDLFDAVLAGMGQCGLIVRARIRLTAMPKAVAIRRFTYQDRHAFLHDMAMFARTEPAGSVIGNLRRTAGGFANQLDCMVWLDQPDDPRPPAWLSVIRGEATGPVQRVSYAAYANALTRMLVANEVNDAAQGPRPRVHAFIPAPAAPAVLDFLATDPDAALGVNTLPVLPLLAASFTQPLLRMPAGDLSFNMRLYRIASAEGADDHRRMLAINLEKVIPRVVEAGGTFYLPHTPILNPAQVARQYDPAALAALRRAKTTYDPHAILNPGAGIF